MGLINLKTNLKNNKYGNDRPGNGSSSQPYIKQPLTVNLPPSLNFLGSDFILRGGPVGAPLATANDVLRLTKYFTDTKTPSGLLFIAKQNLLSRTAVRTQASGRLVNEGVYTPLSTLAQAGVSAFGFHFNKQGLNPIPGAPGSLRTYSDVVGNDVSPIAAAISGLSLNASSLITGVAGNILGGVANPASSITANRLVALYGVKVNNSKASYLANSFISVRGDNVNLISYQGGPGSILGIGLTNIKFADQRTGKNNQYYGKNPNYLDGLKNSLTDRESEAYVSQIQKPTGVSDIYRTLYPSASESLEISTSPIPVKSSPYSGSSNYQYITEATDTNNAFATYDEVTTTGPVKAVIYTQQELLDSPSYWGDTLKLTDFRAKLREKAQLDSVLLDASKLLISDSPDYTEYKIEKRVNLGDPGNKQDKNLTSYTSGSNGSGSASPNSYDRITVLPLYKSDGPNLEKPINDLVKFRIAAIDNDDPTQKVYMHFRAFLGSISDSYDADWNASKYVGRGENFYTYGGFDRKISLSFTVAAQSKIELIPMYKKLNYLASNLAPDYSGVGYMRGPLVTLTVGGYIYEQPGFITGLSFEMSEESPWEIGINDEGNSDSTVKELTHIIKVSGFNFTPIHNFAPRKADYQNLGQTPFIALANGPVDLKKGTGNYTNY